MSDFAHTVDSHLRPLADSIPNWPLYTAGISMPIWWPSLAQVSQIAGLVTPILLLVMALIKVYGEFVRWLEAREASGRPVGRGMLRVGAAILAALGIVALLAWMTAPKASAAPATPTITKPAGKRRKPEEDDEGDDADELKGKSRLYDKAMEFLGVGEALPNGRANPDVRAMFAAVKGWKDEDGKITADPRKVPWCAVFVNYCLMQLGVPGTNSAMARSFNLWGKGTDDPKCGDVVTFWRGSYDNGEAGHVAIFIRFVGDYVEHIGGNQSNAVTVTKTHKSRVLQYRRHMSLWQSRQMWGAAAKGGAAAGTAAVAVKEAVSDPSTPTQSASEQITAVREPISQVSEFLPGRWQTYALLACALLGLLGVAVVWWERRRYRQEIGW